MVGIIVTYTPYLIIFTKIDNFLNSFWMEQDFFKRISEKNSPGDYSYSNLFIKYNSQLILTENYWILAKITDSTPIYKHNAKIQLESVGNYITWIIAVLGIILFTVIIH